MLQGVALQARPNMDKPQPQRSAWPQNEHHSGIEHVVQQVVRRYISVSAVFLSLAQHCRRHVFHTYTRKNCLPKGRCRLLADGDGLRIILNTRVPWTDVYLCALIFFVSRLCPQLDFADHCENLTPNSKKKLNSLTCVLRCLIGCKAAGVDVSWQIVGREADPTITLFLWPEFPVESTRSLMPQKICFLCHACARCRPKRTSYRSKSRTWSGFHLNSGPRHGHPENSAVRASFSSSWGPRVHGSGIEVVRVFRVKVHPLNPLNTVT